MGTESRAMRSQEAMWAVSFAWMVDWIRWASDIVLPLWEPYATTKDTPGIAEQERRGREEGRGERGEEENKEGRRKKEGEEVDVKRRKEDLCGTF
jgi:hypothetical protein